MKVADIMSKKVITIRSFATVADAVRLMQEHNLNSLIVERLDESDSYGIVTKTDVIYKVTAKGLDPKQVRICDIMTKPCITVNPDLSTQSAAQLFAKTGIHRAPIIRDKLLGMISMTDLLLKSNFVEQPLSVLIETQIEQKVAEAGEILAEQELTSENLEAEQADQKTQELEHTAVDKYCEEHPDEEIGRHDPWFRHWEDAFPI